MSEPSIQFDALSFVCDDVEATIAFYRQLGFDVPEDKIWRTDTGPHHTQNVPIGPAAAIEFDSQALARHYHAGYQLAPPGGALMIGFSVPTREAVDELHQKLVAAGHASRQEPYDAFWGSRYAIVADPDGRDVSFMSPPDRALGSRPPDL